MTSLLLASFIAGFLTILVPCLLPLLPVIIGGSVVGDQNRKRNPFIIIGSLLGSIVIFTIIIQIFSSFFYIPNEFWGIFSGVLVLFVGLTFVFPKFWSFFSFAAKSSIFFNKSIRKGIKRKGVLGDVIIGASLGPIFSSCSPTYLLILATILPASFFEGLLYLSSFVIGLGIVLLLISLLGQIFVEKLNILADENGTFKKVVGVIMILIALMIFFGFDKTLATFLLDIGFIDISQFELEL